MGIPMGMGIPWRFPPGFPWIWDDYWDQNPIHAAALDLCRYRFCYLLFNWKPFTIDITLRGTGWNNRFILADCQDLINNADNEERLLHILNIRLVFQPSLPSNVIVASAVLDFPAITPPRCTMIWSIVTSKQVLKRVRHEMHPFVDWIAMDGTPRFFVYYFDMNRLNIYCV